MEITTLIDLGLTESQAKAYLMLIQFGTLSPPELARKTGETRSNAYKVLDRLEGLGLAIKKTGTKKRAYRATNPVQLEALAKQHRAKAMEQEEKVLRALPKLLTFFNTYSEQPGIRFFQGQDGIKQIFDDMLRTKQPIYLIRSPADIKFYDQKFFEKFKVQRARLGIKTYALTPDIESATHDIHTDEINLFTRTWLPRNAYTGSVEWNLYGNKLAIISYGEEAMGVIIESPQIAASFQQLFLLMQGRFNPTSR